MKGSVKRTERARRSPKYVPGVPVPTSSGSAEMPWDRIAGKAYELWEQRGHRQGYDLEDWFDAEAIVKEERHDARE